METYKVTIELTEKEVLQISAACTLYVATFDKMGIDTPLTKELAVKMMSLIKEFENGPF